MTPLLTGVFASQISGRLNTFTPTGSYDALATYTVPSGGVSSITFAGLPTGGQYQHLQIRGIVRFAGNDGGFGMFFNGDTTGTNYYAHNLGTSGSGIPYTQNGNEGWFIWSMANNSATSGVFNGFVADVADYSNTSKYKTSKILGGYDNNGSGRMLYSSQLWNNKNAINSIKFDARIQGSTSDFAEFSQFSIYGVKG
jgi:hypothetical protein